MKGYDFKKELLRLNVKTKYDLAFEVSGTIVDMRIHAGLSQEKLAKRAGTHQSAIARVEGGSRLPSLAFLQRLAHAAGGEIYVSFKPRPKKKPKRK